jgi:Arc/MetJ-type ribon-helix-helix transcriptional regulator
MANQITVRLPDYLDLALRKRADQLQRKPSEVVRTALQEFLDATEPYAGRRGHRVKSLIGSLDSGIPDLAERHREYVLGRLRRER